MAEPDRNKQRLKQLETKKGKWTKGRTKGQRGSEDEQPRRATASPRKLKHGTPSSTQPASAAKAQGGSGYKFHDDILPQNRAKKAAGAVKGGLESEGRKLAVTGRTAGRGIASAAKGVGKGIASAAKGTASAIKGAPALKPGGILRTGASTKPKPAAKKPGTGLHKKPYQPPQRKPASNQKTRRGVRSQ